MRITRWLWPIMMVSFAGFTTGCGDDDSGDADGPTNTGSGTDTGTGTGTAGPASEGQADIIVDVNRDGALDDADQTAENDAWTATTGASFLANIDDDNEDGFKDTDDQVVNGAEDELDLARIQVSAWPDAPDGATGVLTLDERSTENVRVFKQTPEGWAIVAGVFGNCNAEDPTCEYGAFTVLTTEEIRAGVTLAIEARDFARTRTTTDPAAWSGIVDLSYQAVRADGVPFFTQEDPESGFDRAKLRVAPWQMFGNHTPGHDVIYSVTWSQEFVAGLTAAANDSGDINYSKYSNYADQWTEDFFQTGWTAIPVAGGEVHGMRIANSRPFDQAGGVLPIKWLEVSYLGPDRGILEIYNVPNSGTTADSHGNHDLIPPYTNPANGADYPQGQIIVGSNVLPETLEFYETQNTQSPHLELYTDWLIVAHIDEVFSYVPAATPRGWKLLVGDSDLAISMLEDLQTQGYGATEMFVGKNWYAGAGGEISATVTIDETLADTDIIAWSNESQAEVDDMLDGMIQQVGLAPDEIIKMPFLMEEDFGRKVAYQPGTVNLLNWRNHIAVPKPFGPDINGVDPFEQDIIDRLGTSANQLGSDGNGLEVFFVDNWDLYHRLLGEVHCGTNFEAPAPFDPVKWWETGR